MRLGGSAHGHALGSDINTRLLAEGTPVGEIALGAMALSDFSAGGNVVVGKDSASVLPGTLASIRRETGLGDLR